MYLNHTYSPPPPPNPLTPPTPSPPGKTLADFTMVPYVSSHIFRLAHRNFMKLTQKLYLMIFLIIAELKEILSTETWLELQIWQKFR